MKELKKKVMLLLLTAAMLTGLLGVMPAQAAKAQAAVPSVYTKEMVLYVVSNEKIINTVVVQNVSKKSQITNLKSSNPGIADVKAEERDGFVSINVIPKKTGTAKISFKAKYDNNRKSKKLSFNIILKKYVNPCTSFKIGSKEYKGEYKKTIHADLSVSGKKKISVKAANGWKISYIGYFDEGGEQQLKNNSTVTLKKGGTLDVVFSRKGAKNEDYISLGVIIK